jgi:hypothetical protein
VICDPRTEILAFMTVEVENLQKNNAPECQAFEEKASQSLELA